MTSLRMRVVEAGARAYFGGFDVMAEGGQQFCIDVAAQVLDRMLDCLAENADGWVGAYWGELDPDPYEVGVVSEVAKRLVDVLREGR